jgi:hypothetical protein
MVIFSRTRLRFTASVAMLLAGVASTAAAAPFLPNFAAATFIPGAAIDHPYFPLLNAATYRYEGVTVDEDNDPITESFEFHPVTAGPTILGVQTTSRLDRSFVDGLVQEDTFDYFAQDTAGNVWYMGEDVTNYIYDGEDVLIGTNSASTWRAGVNGALPGFQMPADLSLGFNYFQEKADADQAVDQARTQGLLDQVVVDFGTFTDVLLVFESSAIDPTFGYKYYARGFGLILEDKHLDAQFRVPEFSQDLVSVSAVPIPVALPLLGSALVGLMGIKRRSQI